MEQVKREFEQRWQDLGQFVKEKRRLGEMSGISNPYLSQIERAPELTEAQKRALIHIYESFRESHADRQG